MIQLQPNDYFKVTDILNAVQFNNYFARAVVLHHIKGKIYVDRTENPRVFYIYHPYGMSLLLGDYTSIDFKNDFRNYCLNTDENRDKADWLQVYPFEWNAVIEEIANSTSMVVELYERVNFKLNREKYDTFRKTIELKNWEIVATTAEVFESMPGTVVPRFFWDSAMDFVKNSKGFTLFVDNQPVSTAFASFLIGDILEIGIQTVDGLYGKGYSALSCCKLIDYCIENNFEPIWSCKKDNIGSVKLAQKLGFEVVRIGTYYKINY